jgi:hypothetical protein
MHASWGGAGLAVGFWTLVIPAFPAWAKGQTPARPAEITLKGSLICNGACVPEPKAEDHVLVVFAIDGTPAIRAEVDRIVKEFYPDKGLDAEAAQKLMDQFSTRLKFYVAPDSRAGRR